MGDRQARSAVALGLALYFASGTSAASEDSSKGPTTTAGSNGPSTAVELGARYRAGWPFRVLFGTQWRTLWTTPVTLPVLDVARFDGGLTPLRRGGGLQTKNLRLRSGAGRTWVFRSVDKDPTRVFEPELRESLIGDIYQDLTSTSDPVAPLVVAPLLEAVGVPHATPYLAMMPDDPKLGEFRDFGGVVGLIELRPEEGFEGSEKTARTLQLFARFEKGRPKETIDVRTYLRARLIDMLVGDWDRHVDQWRWIRFDEDDKRVWRPVPQDRDQAFSRFDGVVPSLAEYYTKQLVSFGPKYPSIEKLTFSGRYIDRRFLTGLSKQEWQAITIEVVSRLSNEVLAEAVRRMPAELYAKGGAELEQALRSRRDALAEASDELYRLLADRVDVYGTEGADYAMIRRSEEGIELSLHATDPRTGDALDPPSFHRAFHRGETSEIRLYLLGGSDRVVEEGKGQGGIRVRIVPDRVESPPDPTARVAAANPGIPQIGASVSDVDPPDDPLRRRYEPYRDWGHDLLFFPQLSYDPTRGLVAGAMAELTRYDFGRPPYAERMDFGAAWSTGTNRPRLETNAAVNTGTPVHGLLYLSYSGMDFVRFYGFGNGSVRDPVLDAADRYVVHQEQVIVHPVLEAALVGPLSARGGLMLKHVSSTRGSPFSTAPGAYGFDGTTLASGEVGLSLDTRSGNLTRLRGMKLELTGRYYPHLFDSAEAFEKLRAEASVLLGTDAIPNLLFSLRMAGEKNWGRYPFFEAAFIGGAATRAPLDITGASTGNLLRGYDLDRFAGDASVVANSELRLVLGKYSAILPFRYGVFGLADVGRVFFSPESSKTWHVGAGGGLWLALFAAGKGFELVSTMNLALVRSDEGTGVYFSGGFGL
jgi:hypothetical protein